MIMLRSFIRLARPGQWIKNIFVLAGLFFSGKAGEHELMLICLASFLMFSLASSSVYAFNDCLDANEDRNNPDKKGRPIASGELSLSTGYFFSALLALITVILSWFLNFKIFVLVLVYILLNIAYTLKLKRMVIVDVFCISIGFMLRVFAGTYAVGIPPSHWIIICTMMISLFLGFGKRYAELAAHPDSLRSVMKNYSKTYLEILLGVSASTTILSYGLYTISPRTIEQHGSEYMIYSLPFVIFGLFRYLYIMMHENSGQDPNKAMFLDRQILLTLLAYAICVFFIIS